MGNGGGGSGAINTVGNEAALLLVSEKGGFGFIAEITICGDGVAGGDEGTL